MAAGEGVEPSFSGSKPDVLPVAPSRKMKFRVSGFELRTHHNSKPETRNSKLNVWSRWQELNRHRSIINRVLWPLSYTAFLKIVAPASSVEVPAKVLTLRSEVFNLRHPNKSPGDLPGRHSLRHQARRVNPETSRLSDPCGKCNDPSRVEEKKDGLLPK